MVTTPYLEVSEYISRFGERETILLTNDQALGGATTYDSAKVSDAIDDSSEVVDGYIGQRYVVPVIDPPRIVKGWVAALAREALHVNVNRVTDAVKAAADRARQQLLDVSKGNMTLPIAEGDAPLTPSNGLGYAASSLDRPTPVVTDQRLADFTAPFTGYCPTPAWRNGGGG